MRTPSLQSVDSQFDVLFGAHVLPDDIAPPAPRGHEPDEDGVCMHCGYHGRAPQGSIPPCV
ncbi:hypothetical protein D3C81_1049660 [compost metagenome]